VRIFSREQAYNLVCEDLVVGRRLLPREVPDDFVNYVDLTAELEDPAAIRRGPGYLAFPLLDASAPNAESLRAAVRSLRPGSTFIHCAQGHGRTGLFAVALLLSSGAVQTPEEGVALVRSARPGIRLSPDQRRCLKLYATQRR
jgi:protein-tyrosine phosphatase